MEKYKCENGHISYSSTEPSKHYLKGCSHKGCNAKVSDDIVEETHEEFVARAQAMNRNYMSRLVTSGRFATCDSGDLEHRTEPKKELFD